MNSGQFCYQQQGAKRTWNVSHVLFHKAPSAIKPPDDPNIQPIFGGTFPVFWDQQRGEKRTWNVSAMSCSTRSSG